MRQQEYVLFCDKEGDPLVVLYDVGGGRVALMLQKALRVHDPGCGAIWWNNEKPGISGTLFELVDILADMYLPVKVEGDVQSLYNISRDGWLVTLINHDGVRHRIMPNNCWRF